MLKLLLSAAQAPTAAEGLFTPLLMIFVTGVAFYFMILKPQKKQQKEYKETMESLKVGNIVVTRSGARGKVVELNDKTFILETGKNNTQIEFLRQSISYIDNNNDFYGPENSETQFSNTPVGNLNYGEDKRFIDKLNSLKNDSKEYDLLLEDVYEFVVVENDTAEISVQNKFRLPEDRVKLIFSELEELGVISEADQYGKRDILVDPR